MNGNVGEHYKAMLNLFAGLAIATGVAQVAPRVFHWVDRTNAYSPPFLVWTAALALAIGIVEVLAILVHDSHRMDPKFVYLDFAGELLVFVLFAAAHRLELYLLTLTLFCISIAAYRYFDRNRQARLDFVKENRFDRSLPYVRVVIIFCAYYYWRTRDYLDHKNLFAVYVTLAIVAIIVALAYCPILKRLRKRYELEMKNKKPTDGLEGQDAEKPPGLAT